jgi:hypothetical protein
MTKKADVMKVYLSELATKHVAVVQVETFANKNLFDNL